MTRIIAGACRGRRLTVPPGRDTRPTSDRVREAMFSTIESELGPLSGLHVVDLYAGSGALGLEALSRGAEHALLVESGARTVRTIRTNVSPSGYPAPRWSRHRLRERWPGPSCDRTTWRWRILHMASRTAS